MKEIETNEELTDVIEMHFIEIPKLQSGTDEKDMLVAWTEFLKDPESEKVARNLLDILDDETIATKTGLTIDEVKQLR